jgi:hypothetical protein
MAGFYYANKNLYITQTVCKKKRAKELGCGISAKFYRFLITAGYHNISSLKNVRLEFLPPPPTYLLQPMDMRVA